MSIENELLARLAKVAARPVEPVEIGGEVFHVRGFDSHARSIYVSSIMAAAQQNSILPDYCIVALGLVDEGGAPVFAEAAQGFDALKGMDGAVLSKLATKIRDLSKLGAKAMEQAEKN